MNFKSSNIVAGLACLISMGSSHFVLQIPTSIGYNDALEGTAPCGSFSATDRSKGVTNWQVAGAAISVITTHTSVTWDFKAALVSSPTTWVLLTPVLTQTGVGFFCEPKIPGLTAWIGQPAILQVTQHGVDCALYQCAAIQFVAGTGTTPSGCTNSSGIAAHW
ncbi:hypothetical protein BGZ60DRAFT_388634 [Tricladium varicosporioides]|nr:hypothetical protein BGZ60DRAFT_388634 [Hymenoscyphus varicosporioides]